MFSLCSSSHCPPSSRVTVRVLSLGATPVRTASTKVETSNPASSLIAARMSRMISRDLGLRYISSVKPLFTFALMLVNPLRYWTSETVGSSLNVSEGSSTLDVEARCLRRSAKHMGRANKYP